MGVLLSGIAWVVLVGAGFGGERATCADPLPGLSTAVSIGTALAATAGWLLSVWAYARSADEPSGEWLAGAAGLYVTTLAWGATLTGAVALQLVDVC